ncbi:hypothetical protein [Aliagarivorans taiwanensis]|uniref:hypothetical protein n=1 Tax=Aliagarivorans taiwanensis TaxID=561966 RepID=UPI00047E3D74|nr:hypothetical protein [Aliagarivorans taiwanensis]
MRELNLDLHPRTPLGQDIGRKHREHLFQFLNIFYTGELDAFEPGVDPIAQLVMLSLQGVRISFVVDDISAFRGMFPSLELAGIEFVNEKPEQPDLLAGSESSPPVGLAAEDVEADFESVFLGQLTALNTVDASAQQGRTQEVWESLVEEQSFSPESKEYLTCLYQEAMQLST